MVKNFDKLFKSTLKKIYILPEYHNGRDKSAYAKAMARQSPPSPFGLRRDKAKSDLAKEEKMVKQILGPIQDWQKEKELLVIGFFEEEQLIGSELGKRMLDELSNGNYHILEDFKGKFGQKALTHRMWPKRLLFVGLGKKEDFTIEKHREIAGQIARHIRDMGIKSFSTEIFGNDLNPERIKAQIEGQGIGLYRFEDFKKFPNQVEEIKILAPMVDVKTEEAFKQALTIVEAVCFVRNLINSPADKMGPQKLAYAAQKTGDELTPKIKVQVYDATELEDRKMNLILAVGKGSENKPRLIEMEYKPKNHQNKKPYVLVGKGVCFDSGGLQIKDASSMMGMHTDMAGAAVVIGTLKTIANMNLPLWIVGLTPIVENMPSGGSYKPGDILRAYNGKTIEIAHTDAEGRLILFDAMAYAKEKYNPCLIADIATLTGACKVALGEHYAGLFGNSQKFLRKIKKAGKESGDKVWEMPIGEEYLEEMKSEVADLKNSGPRWGGAITAACFLQEAVGEKQPWIHLDIAGAGRIDVIGKATGFGLRLFVQFFLNEIKSA